MRFENTKKLLVNLILNLLEDMNFLPFLNTKILRLLLQDLTYVSVSFEKIIKKLHLLIQDFLSDVGEFRIIAKFVEKLNNSEIGKNENKYHNAKRHLCEGFTVFERIETEIFKAKRTKIGEKLINFLVSNEVQYQIPSQTASKIESYEHVQQFCLAIENIFESINNEEFNYYKQKFAEIRRSIEDGSVMKMKKSKSASERRQDALLSKNKPGSKENDVRDNVALMKEEMSNYLRLFIKQHILGTFAFIDEKFPTLVYSDTENFGKIIYMDLLEEYCRTFTDRHAVVPRREMIIIFEIIQDFNLRVDVAQTYEAFGEKYKKEYPDAKKEDISKIFFVVLNELKWLGLLNETRKSQISFEKNFFAKTLFRKLGNDKDDDIKDDVATIKKTD